MPEALLYEYAVIRIVPRVEREEFVNAGIVLFCKSRNYLHCKTLIDEKKLTCINNDADIKLLKENLLAFESIAKGISTNSSISQLDAASRFRWLTAIRSTIIQCSKVHPGISVSPEDVFEKLFERLVL